MILKYKKIFLLIAWITIVLNCIFMFMEKEQLLSAVLLVFIGGLLTFMYMIEKKKNISYNVRRAIAFSFDVGILYLILETILKFIKK